MPITHVGTVSGNVTGSPWEITLNFPAGVKKNDLVLTHVFTHRNHPDGGAGGRFQEVTGYKLVGAFSSFHSLYQYKIMGQTPDTSVTLNTLSAPSGAIVRVFRGVDTRNPIDSFFLREQWQDFLDANGDGGALDTGTLLSQAMMCFSKGACIVQSAHFGDGFLEEFGTITPPSGWTGQETVNCDDSTRDDNEVVSSVYKIYDDTSGMSELTFGTWNASGASVPADPVNGFDLNDNGGSADTIVRNDGGSWISDGFAAGREVAVANATNASNNGSYVISSLTASTLTIPTGSLAGTTVADLASSFTSPVNGSGTDEPFLDLNQAVSLRPADQHWKLIYYETGTSSFTLPDDFDPANSMWFLVGGASSGADAGATGGGGGGAPASLTLGAYDLFAAGDTVYCQVGAGGTADSTAGTDTWVSNVSATAPTAVSEGALAKGGGAPSGVTGGTGGSAASNIPATANLGDDTYWTLAYSDSGGTGGNSNSSDEGGGGGASPGFFGKAGHTGHGGRNGGRANLDNYGGGGGGGSGNAGLNANNTDGQEVGGAGGWGVIMPDFVTDNDKAASGTAGRDGWFGSGGGGGGRGASGGNSNAYEMFRASDGMTLGLSGGGGGGGAENTSNVAGEKGGDGFGSTTTGGLGFTELIADIAIGGAGGGGGEGSGGGSVDGLHGDGADGIIIIAYSSLDGLAIWDDNQATVSWSGGVQQDAAGIPPGLLRRAHRLISRSF